MKRFFSTKNFIVTTLIVIAIFISACGGKSSQKTLTIGLIAETPYLNPCIEGFKSGMTDLSYIEGENVVYIDEGIAEDTEAVSAAVEDLLAQEVDMIFVTGNTTAKNAKQALEGTDLPLVFGAVLEPVEEGLVESIQRPGGNITGIQSVNGMLVALEWLVKVDPGVRKIYVPYNPNEEVSIIFFGGIQNAATQLNVELVGGEVQSVEEAITSIENLPEDIDAIFRVPSPTLDPRNNELSQAAIQRGIPLAAGLALDEMVLFSVGSDAFLDGVQAAKLVNQIQQGISPADLPIGTGELNIVVNLQTAEAISIDIPEELLKQADTIIR